MKQPKNHMWAIEKDRVASQDREYRDRLREEEKLFEEQMHSVSERGTIDQRSRSGSYYDMLENERWSLGHQLANGARLAPHKS